MAELVERDVHRLGTLNESVRPVCYLRRWEAAGCGFRRSSGTSTIALTSASTGDVPSRTSRTCFTRATTPLARSRNRRCRVQNRDSCFTVERAWEALEGSCHTALK